MPNARSIFKALAVLVEEFGEDVDHFFDFSRLMESRSIVKELRPVLEENISREYLPGFVFEDDYHAAWFLRKYSIWLTWISDYPIREERVADNWIRMFLVPNRHHYIAEIALAMQHFDQETARLIREFRHLQEEANEPDINAAAHVIQIYRALGGLPPGPIKGERDLMAMQTWRRRLLEKFSDFNPPINDTSIMRLARNAKKYRAQRSSFANPSGWQVVQVTYIGDIQNPDATCQESWERFTHRYFECWVWTPLDGVEPPRKTEFTFREPAQPGLWERKWNKNKKPFRK